MTQLRGSIHSQRQRLLLQGLRRSRSSMGQIQMEPGAYMCWTITSAAALAAFLVDGP